MYFFTLLMFFSYALDVLIMVLFLIKIGQQRKKLRVPGFDALEFFVVFLLSSITLFVFSMLTRSPAAAMTLFKIAGILGVSSNYALYLFSRSLNEKGPFKALDLYISFLYGIIVVGILWSKLNFMMFEVLNVSSLPLEPPFSTMVSMFQISIFSYSIWVIWKIYSYSLRWYKKYQALMFMIALIIGFPSVSITLLIFSYFKLSNPLLRYPIWFTGIFASFYILYKNFDKDIGFYHILPHKIYGFVITNKVGEPICTEFYLSETNWGEYDASGFSAVMTKVFDKITTGYHHEGLTTIQSDEITILIYHTENVVGSILAKQRTELLETYLIKAVNEIEEEFGDKIKNKTLNDLEKEEICLISKDALDVVLP